MKIQQEASERHVLTVMVDNEAGILAKIAGLFTARGYNIDSLTVADITENHSVSRITIVTHGPPAVIDQIHAQLSGQGHDALRRGGSALDVATERKGRDAGVAGRSDHGIHGGVGTEGPDEGVLPRP